MTFDGWTNLTAPFALARWAAGLPRDSKSLETNAVLATWKIEPQLLPKRQYLFNPFQHLISIFATTAEADGALAPPPENNARASK
jgi:hypothetical protein